MMRINASPPVTSSGRDDRTSTERAVLDHAVRGSPPKLATTQMKAIGASRAIFGINCASLGQFDFFRSAKYPQNRDRATSAPGRYRVLDMAPARWQCSPLRGNQ